MLLQPYDRHQGNYQALRLNSHSSEAEARSGVLLESNELQIENTFHAQRKLTLEFRSGICLWKEIHPSSPCLNFSF